METYYSVTYPIKAQSVKFITAIILKDSPASKNIPQVTRLKGDDLQGVRIAKGDKITDVYLNHTGRWAYYAPEFLHQCERLGYRRIFTCFFL